jgi:hypothetical protein
VYNIIQIRISAGQSLLRGLEHHMPIILSNCITYHIPEVHFSDRPLSLSLSVNLHFRLLQNHWTNYNQLGTNHHGSGGWGWLNTSSNVEECPSLRGDNSKNTLKIFQNLLQNHSAILNETWYKSSLGRGNLNLFKLRSSSSSKTKWQKWVGSFKNLLGRLHQRGDNYRNTNIGWGHLKIFSRFTWPKCPDLHESFLI